MPELHDYQPLENEILVAMPERYVQKSAPGHLKLALPPAGGWDRSLIENIADGQMSAYELQVEASDDAHQTLIQQGIVLAVPRRLTDALVLCADPGKSKPKTCADIQDVVAVGDTVHIERHYLVDGDQYEISPGVYRFPYSALICAIQTQYTTGWLEYCGGAALIENKTLRPIGGYVLLSRVWSDDVEEEWVDGTLQKVRYSKTLSGVIEQNNVPPLPFEGIAAHVGVPLRGAAPSIHPGDRVLFEPGYALDEEIAGQSFLVVRREYCMAVREPVMAKS